MSLRRILPALSLAFFIPSALLVALQEDSTNRVAPSYLILSEYFSGTISPQIVGSRGAAIVEARCLVRGALELCQWLGGPALETYNAVIQLASVWAALWMIFLAAARVMPLARACAAVLLAIVFVPWGYLSVGYSVSWPYDLPSLFFASFGLWTVLSRRFALFAATLFVGTLNKETLVFLVPAYLLSEWPLLPRKTLLVRALILAGLFLAAYETPRMLLAGNGLPALTVSTGTQDGPRWQTNLQHLALRKNGTVLENIYWALSIHLLPLLGLSTLPRPLRAIYFAVPVLLVPIFFWGNLYEFRLYNEIIPLGAISTVFAFSRLLETATPAPESAPTAVSRPSVP